MIPPLYSFSPTVSVSVVRRGCSMTEIEEGRGRWTGEFGEEGFAHKPGLKSILWIFSFMFKCRLRPPPTPYFYRSDPTHTPTNKHISGRGRTRASFCRGFLHLMLQFYSLRKVGQDSSSLLIHYYKENSTKEDLSC